MRKSYTIVEPEQMRTHLSKFYSELEVLQVRNWSILFTDEIRSVFVKAFIKEWTYERANHEVEALLTLTRHNIDCPRLIDIHLGDPACWITTDYIRHPPISLRSIDDAMEYLMAASKYLNKIHALLAPSNCGYGWFPYTSDFQYDNACEFVLQQISPPGQLGKFKYYLADDFLRYPSIAVSLLHRDVKIDHFFKTGDTLLLVDWENACRGPAVLDYMSLVVDLLLVLHKIHIEVPLSYCQIIASTVIAYISQDQIALVRHFLMWSCLNWAGFREELDVPRASLLCQALQISSTDLADNINALVSAIATPEL